MIDEIKSSLSVNDIDYEATIQQFKVWTASMDANIVSRVEIGHFNHDNGHAEIVKSENGGRIRGVSAAMDTAVGDTLISVPFQTLLSIAHIEGDSILQPIIGKEAAKEKADAEWGKARSERE